jgi:hypothetical protein
MRWVLRRFFVCFWTSIFAASAAKGGALLLSEGQGQVILTTTFSNASKAFDAYGRLIKTPSYRKFETQTYVEFGALDWLTIVAQTSAMNFHGPSSQLDHLALLTEEAKFGAPLSIRGPPGPRYAGLGVGSLGLRLGLLEIGSYIVSLEASLRAATPSARKFLDMRNELQGDVRLQFGRPVEAFGIPGFCDGQIGYRTAGQSGAEIRADLTYGLRPLSDVMLLAQSFSALTPGKSRETFMYSQKFQLSAVYEVTKDVSLQLGALAALQGVNSSAERGVFGGVWYRFSTSHPASNKANSGLF